MRIAALLFVVALPTFAQDQRAECYKTFITEPAPFLGNGGEIIILADGTIWKEASYKYLYLYAYNPQVVMCPRTRQMTIIGGGTQHQFTLMPIKSAP